MKEYLREDEVTPEIEITARMLCLACGENPDDEVQRWHRPEKTSMAPLWLYKYGRTAQRMLLAGFVCPLVSKSS